MAGWGRRARLSARIRGSKRDTARLSGQPERLPGRRGCLCALRAACSDLCRTPSGTLPTRFPLEAERPDAAATACAFYVNDATAILNEFQSQPNGGLDGPTPLVAGGGGGWGGGGGGICSIPRSRPLSTTHRPAVAEDWRTTGDDQSGVITPDLRAKRSDLSSRITLFFMVPLSLVLVLSGPLAL